jgi:iron complex outermembrane receptor protein
MRTIALFALSGALLLAQPHYMETIAITGDESPTPHQHTIKAQEQGRNHSIADLLQSDPDVHFNRKAPFGDNGDMLSIRGLRGNRLLLNLDGRSLNAMGINGGHYIDFGTLPLDNIERVEVIKGGLLAEYGHNTQGGVINAISRRPVSAPYLTAFISGGGWQGADDFQNARLSYAQKHGAIGASLSASHQKAAPWLWNNRFESNSFSGKLYGDLPAGGELVAGYIHNQTRRGFTINNRQSTDPASADFHQPINADHPTSLGDFFASGGRHVALNWIGENAHWKKRKTMLDLTWRQPLSDALHLEAIYWQNREDRHEKNYATTREMNASQRADFDALSTQEGDLVLDREVASDRSYGYSSKLTAFYDRHEILLGAEAKYQPMGDITLNYLDGAYNDLGGTDRYTGTKGFNELKMTALFLSDTITIDEAWQLYLGVRHDRMAVEKKAVPGTFSKLESYDDRGTSPKLALSFEPNRAHRISLLAYQNFRAPGIPESHWHYSGFYDCTGPSCTPLSDHPDIRPLQAETSDNLELIYKGRLAPGATLRFSAFYSEIEDFIVFKFMRPAVQGAYNIDRVKLYGASLDGQLRLDEKTRLDFGFLGQRGKKSGDALDRISDTLDYLPDWRLLATLTRDFGALKTGLKAEHIGPQSYQSSATRIEKMPAYATLDLSLKYPVTKSLRGELFVQNLLDEAYEERFGYPALGRHGGFSLQYTY